MVDGKVVDDPEPNKRSNKLPVDFTRSTVHGFTSQQLPTWHKAAPRHNVHGEAVFNSLKEVREFEAKSRDMGEAWHYNEV
jgi:hypothetical protein